MKIASLILGSVLAGSLLTMGAAQAGDGAAEKCGHHPGYRGDRMMPMSEMLELDKKQREAISKIRESEMQQMRDNNKEMRKLQDAMREQARAENYDAAKIRELADAQAKLMADMMVKRMESKNQIRKLLSEQQVARMELIKKRMKERMQRRKSDIEDR